MALSPYFSDEDLISQLRVQFDYDKMFDFDFKQIFSQIVERENDYFLRLRGRQFSIDKRTGGVTEFVKTETSD